MFEVGARVQTINRKTGRIANVLVEYIGGEPRLFYVVDLEGATGPNEERTYLDSELTEIADSPESQA